MFHRLRGVVCLWCLLALTAPLALATTVLQLTNQELAYQADVILVGKCVELRTAWVDRTLVTLATIQVAEFLKGSSNTVTVVLPGGIDANRRVPIAMSYPGAPQITLDEEVFLFLQDDSTSRRGYTVLDFHKESSAL